MEAEQVAGEYEGSRLSRIEFCRKHGLSLATLARYRKLLGQGEAVRGGRRLAVEVAGAKATPPGRSGLAVALPGGRAAVASRSGAGLTPAPWRSC